MECLSPPLDMKHLKLYYCSIIVCMVSRGQLFIEYVSLTVFLCYSVVRIVDQQGGGRATKLTQNIKQYGGISITCVFGLHLMYWFWICFMPNHVVFVGFQTLWHVDLIMILDNVVYSNWLHLWGMWKLTYCHRFNNCCMFLRKEFLVNMSLQVYILSRVMYLEKGVTSIESDYLLNIHLT